jgi:protein-tyrosine phosphatase
MLPDRMASILIVCTGNVCRSPMAEGFLRTALDDRFGRSAPSVASAGTAGWEGSSAMPEAIQAAAERGVDISAHRGRRLTVSDVEEADVVLAMAAEHREAVVRAVPGAEPRTFTLKELVRLLESLPQAEQAEDAGAALSDRIEEAARLRQGGFEGNPHDEDVADPLGMPVHTYRAVAWELEDLVSRLAEGAFGAARSPVVPPRGGTPG